MFGMLRFCAVIALLSSAAAPFFAEGAQRFRIDAVSVEGLPDEPPVPDAVLLSFPIYYDRSSEVGRPIYAISKILSDGGYPYNRIWESITVNSVDDGDSVVSISLNIRIDPGERVCMGRPLIVAYNKRPGIYYRDVVFAPDAPYSAAAVEETVKRLLSRPYVKTAAAASPVIIEDAPKCRDTALQLSSSTMPIAVAAISVTERRGMEAEGALGYESGRGGSGGNLSGRLNLSFVNMLRGGELIDLSYAGTQTAQRLKSSAAYPLAFDLPFDLGGSLGAEVEDGGYGYFGGGISASAEIGARLRCGVSLAASETVPPDSGNPYAFYGADVFLELKRRQWERGAVVAEFSVKTGSGAAKRENKSYTRNKAEAAAGLHYPVLGNYAAAGRVCAKSLFTEEKYLPPAELYRTGGHGSLRGYSEDEHPFRSTAFSQIELLYYFDRAGSVYVFTDGGLGFNEPNRLSMKDADMLLGYGIGLRFPSRLGAVSLEWARNIDDRNSLGRLHVGVRTGI